jgi:hypothetical protein
MDTSYFEDFSDKIGIFEQVRVYFEVSKDALNHQTVKIFSFSGIK